MLETKQKVMSQTLGREDYMENSVTFGSPRLPEYIVYLHIYYSVIFSVLCATTKEIYII